MQSKIYCDLCLYLDSLFGETRLLEQPIAELHICIYKIFQGKHSSKNLPWEPKEKPIQQCQLSPLGILDSSGKQIK